MQRFYECIAHYQVTMNIFGDLLSFDPLQLVIIVVLQYLSAVMTNDEGQLECELVLINKHIHVY